MDFCHLCVASNPCCKKELNGKLVFSIMLGGWQPMMWMYGVTCRFEYVSLYNFPLSSYLLVSSNEMTAYHSTVSVLSVCKFGSFLLSSCSTMFAHLDQISFSWFEALKLLQIALYDWSNFSAYIMIQITTVLTNHYLWSCERQHSPAILQFPESDVLHSSLTINQWLKSLYIPCS